MIGFPPHAFESRRYVLRQFELCQVAEETMRALGWRFERLSDEEFLAHTPRRLRNVFRSVYGEKITIKIQADGLVTAESRSPFGQFIDSGDNRRNVFEFFHEFWQHIPAAALVGGHEREHPFLDKGVFSPVEEITKNEP